MLGSGNGNGGSATGRPPIGGGGVAGWDEGMSQFVVPQSVVPAVSVPTAANTSSVEEPAEGDSFKSGLWTSGTTPPHRCDRRRRP